MHKSWQVLLKEEMNKEYFKQIQIIVENDRKDGDVYPEKGLVFNAFNADINSLKVLLLGQDPYHDSYIDVTGKTVPTAHGLSFSCLHKTPPSLKNIYKEIKSEYSEYVIPTDGNLTNWCNQGVMLLNSFLTVKAHQPGSHANIGWELFTDEVIRIISYNNDAVVFMLWGNFAKSKRNLIDSKKHLILESAHPSPFSARNGFFGNNHFKTCNEYLKQKGLTEINW